ncbi:MAG: hypothetical protein CBC12_12815 [Candidatus Puniceispirillum sp. TMED52]|nr:hypothetical protein [SAR116 cluster bacterium]OUU45195.1 MAG: hypothetical protein CBC12_12815 [Candidatus Puniceispirillum sp. TMED52]HCP18678.1 hypothetical protein [Alphaproteobacteria bacterium]
MAIQIYAVGGGGFTHADNASSDNGRPDNRLNGDPLLEDRLLDLTGAAQSTHIGYIGHASADNPQRIANFHKRFYDCAETRHLPISADASEATAFFQNLDIVYIGGGETATMLAHWQRSGITALLMDAIRQGVVMAGVSAGAICWFSDLLLGNSSDGYELHPGLGLLAGSACPHYSNEAPRKNAYHHHIADGSLSSGIAIDDGVAVWIVDGVVKSVDIARDDGSNAYVISQVAEGVNIRPLKAGHDIGFANIGFSGLS